MPLLVITGLVFFAAQSAAATTAGASQAQLLSDLFDGYSPDVRPICDVNAATVVRVGLAVRQIIELDEPKQILYLNAWVRLQWQDCSLVWNASNYSNIDTIIVPFSKVWTPDITLYDNGDSELEGSKDYLVSVYSSGSCSYNYPTIIQVLCKIDVTYFPFDTQACPLKFGSWSYHLGEVDVTNRSETGDIRRFVPNTEWDVLSMPLHRTVTEFPKFNQSYPDVTFYVNMKRKPLFYVLNLLFPCLLITAVALLGFLLPPDAGEKVSLEITVLLSLAVFLLVVSETLPATSDGFPFIGVYFAMAMLLVSLSTLLTVLVLNVHHKGNLNRPVPRWVRKYVLHYMARVVLVQNERSVHPHDSKSHKTGEDNRSFQQETYINGYQEFQNREHAHCNGGGNGVAVGIKTNYSNGQPPHFSSNHHKNEPISSELTERPLGVEFSQPVSGSNNNVTRPTNTASGRGGGRVSAGGRLDTPHILEDDGLSSEVQNPMLAILRQQLRIMEREESRIEIKSRHDHMSSEWKRVGIVLDRVFFCLFFLLMTVSSLGILLQLSTSKTKAVDPSVDFD